MVGLIGGDCAAKDQSRPAVVLARVQDRAAGSRCQIRVSIFLCVCECEGVPVSDCHPRECPRLEQTMSLGRFSSSFRLTSPCFMLNGSSGSNGTELAYSLSEAETLVDQRALHKPHTAACCVRPVSDTNR